MIHISDKGRHFDEIIVTARSNKKLPKTKITLTYCSSHRDNLIDVKVVHILKCFSRNLSCVHLSPQPPFLISTSLLG